MSTENESGDCVMTFTPTDTPTHGGQSIFMSFSSIAPILERGCLYYVIFEGSKLRHITSAVVINPYTLQAIVPDHDQAEVVILSVCHSKEGSPVALATDKFSYTLSSTYLLAQSLVSSCSSASMLNQLEHGQHAFADLPSADLQLIDTQLAQAFRALKLPAAFRLLPIFADCPIKWTLFHFCAKHNMRELASYLIRLPGATEALKIVDSEGRMASSLAEELSHASLAELFSGSPLANGRTEETCLPDKPLVRQHRLGTTTITSLNKGGQQALDGDIKRLEELRTLVKTNCKGDDKAKNSTDSVISTDSPAPTTATHPLETSLKRLREINLEIERLQEAACDDDMADGGQRIETNNEVVMDDADSLSCRLRSASLPASLSNGLSEDDDDDDDCFESNARRSASDSDSDITDDTDNVLTASDELASFNYRDNEALNDKVEVAVESGIIRTDCVDDSELASANDVTGDVDLRINNEHAAETNQIIDGHTVPEEDVSSDDDVGIAVRAAVEFILDRCVAIIDGEVEQDGLEGVASSPEVDAERQEGSPCSDRDDNEARFLDSVTEETEEDLLFAESSEKDNGTLRRRSAPSKIEIVRPKSDVFIAEDEAPPVNVESISRLNDAPPPSLERIYSLPTGTPLMSSNQGTLMLQDGSLPVAKERKPSPPKKDVFLVPTEPVPAAKRRKGKKKNDRPLSDSFENMKMLQADELASNLSVKKKHRFFFFGDARSSNLSKKKSKSLDTVLIESQNAEALKPVSQPSLASVHGSVDSIQLRQPTTSPTATSDSLGPTPPRSRIQSDLSLSDVSVSVDDSARSSPVSNPDKAFFKSRSLDALRDSQKKPKVEEDRRKTIMGAICVDKIQIRRSQEVDNLSLNSEPLPDGKRPLSFSESSPICLRPTPLENIIRRESHETSDTDTDEGTSSEIADKVTKNVPGGDDKRKEKRFGLLGRSRPKSKKTKESKKEKEKEKEAVEPKVLKRSSKAASTVKNDAKSSSSFLGKRGSSFRNSLKGTSLGPTVSVSTPSDTKVQLRGPTASNQYHGTNRHSIALGSLRGQERQRSPTSTKRMSVHDFESQADELASMNFTRGLSSSRTSLDSLTLQNDDDAVDAAYQEDPSQYDSDLDIRDEPETWSELVDKKVQRKMHAKDIKRQDVIYELILTESNYVRTLKIMAKIYYAGMIREVGLSEDVVETIFPRLSNLLEINGMLLDKMKERQENSQNFVMESIGDILVEQFGGDNGEYMKEIYGQFCSGHLQAVALYKELLKTDKKFNIFMKKCMMSERVRRMSVPECITLTTQRLTKYPLLIEAIIKATKESKPDYEHLKASLLYIKRILKGVDDYVRDLEKQQRLQEIVKKTDTKGEVQDKSGKVYKKSKIFNKRSQLIHEGPLTWKGKAKTVDTRTVLLANKIIFLQEKDQKYLLLSVDQKAPVIPLKNLMVREVATDNKAIFLVSTSVEGPEIYELVCSHHKDKKLWMNTILDAVQSCPDEDDEVQSDVEEELRREEEYRLNKLRDIIENLHGNDLQVQSLVNDKQKLVVEMRDLIEKMDASSKVTTPTTELRTSDVMQARDTLEAAINEAAALSSMLVGADSNLSPSPSSSTLQIGQPKRAETFSGFDTKSKAVPVNNNQVLRTSSMKQEQIKATKPGVGVMETDSGFSSAKDLKNKRQSQSGSSLLSMLGKSKVMGSQEDLSSVSSASSTSLATLTSATQQQQLGSLLQLREYLSSLVGITSKQDTELATLRLELQETRSSIQQLRQEKQELDDKLTAYQREFDRSSSKHQEHSTKLQREFKRTVDKLNREIQELQRQNQQLMASQQSGVVRKNSVPGSGSKFSDNHSEGTQSDSSKHRGQYDSQDVIFF